VSFQIKIGQHLNSISALTNVKCFFFLNFCLYLHFTQT